MRGSCLVVVAGALLGAVACTSEQPDIDLSKPGEGVVRPTVPESLLAEGRLAYERYCVGCHGPNGDGNGPAARFLHPRPRNLQLGNFKFSSTRAGQLPTDEDLKRTLRSGLKGSAMPSFNLLPEPTIEALVAYLKTFSPKWQERGPGEPIPFVPDPYRTQRDKSAAVARGEAVYHGYATCWSCHPAYVPEEKINEYLETFGSPARAGFRPNLEQSVGKANTEGELIFPPDFRRDFVRAGADVTVLYRSIAAGITGTAMPTWVDSIHLPGANPGDPPIASHEDIWAMAYYVQQLVAQRPARLGEGQFVVRDRKQRIPQPGEKPEVAAPEEGLISTEEVFEEE